MSVECTLLDGGRNAAERGVQAGTDSSHSADNDNGDERGDQAILNSRGARLVTQKILDRGHCMPQFFASRSMRPARRMQPDLLT